MPETAHELAVQKIADMAVVGARISYMSEAVDREQTRQFVVVPENCELKELPQNTSRPVRARGNISVDDINSFKTLCARFSEPEKSVIYVRAMIGTKEGFSLTTVAVFNDHEKGAVPAYRDHSATFTARMTPSWLAWQQANGKYMTQEEFATFLEDQLPDIFSPENDANAPTGTQILELARNLEINKSAKFRSSIRTTSGAVELEMIETESDASKGRIQIFERFFIAVRPFFGASPWTFEARIRFRTDNESKSVKFKVDLVRSDRVLEHVVEDFKEDLTTIGLPVISGEPRT